MSSFDPCCKKTTLPNRILSFSLHSHCGHSLALASETGSCWTWHNKISFPPENNWVHSLWQSAEQSNHSQPAALHIQSSPLVHIRKNSSFALGDLLSGHKDAKVEHVTWIVCKNVVSSQDMFFLFFFFFRFKYCFLSVFKLEMKVQFHGRTVLKLHCNL